MKVKCYSDIGGAAGGESKVQSEPGDLDIEKRTLTIALSVAIIGDFWEIL